MVRFLQTPHERKRRVLFFNSFFKMYISNTILGRGERNSTSMYGGADACIALLLMLGKVISETSL